MATAPSQERAAGDRSGHGVNLICACDVRTSRRRPRGRGRRGRRLAARGAARPARPAHGEGRVQPPGPVRVLHRAGRRRAPGGLRDPGPPGRRAGHHHPRRAWPRRTAGAGPTPSSDTGASQCGFCTPGIILRLAALRPRRRRRPSRVETCSARPPVPVHRLADHRRGRGRPRPDAAAPIAAGAGPGRGRPAGHPRRAAPPSGSGPTSPSARRVRRRPGPAWTPWWRCPTAGADGRWARRSRRPGPRPARSRAGAAGRRCATRSRCRPATGPSPCGPPGSSPPTSSPTPPGAGRAASRPRPSPTAARSAASWPPWRRTAARRLADQLRPAGPGPAVPGGRRPPRPEAAADRRPACGPTGRACFGWPAPRGSRPRWPRWRPGSSVEEVDVAGPPTSAGLRAAGWAEAAVLLAVAGRRARAAAPGHGHIARGRDRHRRGRGRRGRARPSRSASGCAAATRSTRWCCAPTPSARPTWRWAGCAREGIAVDDEGVPQDLTIRSFGILRARDTPDIDVTIDAATRAAGHRLRCRVRRGGRRGVDRPGPGRRTGPLDEGGFHEQWSRRRGPAQVRSAPTRRSSGPAAGWSAPASSACRTAVWSTGSAPGHPGHRQPRGAAQGRGRVAGRRGQDHGVPHRHRRLRRS